MMKTLFKIFTLAVLSGFGSPGIAGSSPTVTAYVVCYGEQKDQVLFSDYLRLDTVNFEIVSHSLRGFSIVGQKINRHDGREIKPCIGEFKQRILGDEPVVLNCHSGGVRNYFPQDLCVR